MFITELCKNRTMHFNKISFGDSLYSGLTQATFYLNLNLKKGSFKIADETAGGSYKTI